MQKITLFFLLSLILACKPDDYKAFNETKRQNTDSSYTSFIQRYPNSKYVAQAIENRLKLDSINIVISTFLGNFQRNFYGDSLPDKLDTIWRFYLGEGLSPAYGYDKIWKGAGWTGQPLLVNEKGHLYIIQGAFDYGLHKIDAETGKEVWVYKFDDILKGTGTIWVNKKANSIDERYVIIQGSRKGWDKDKTSQYCWSLRAVSYITGKELWRMNSVSTACYSRDVDGSALIFNDTAYLALENALFTVFNPDFRAGDTIENFIVPKIYKQLQYYTPADTIAHGDDLVAEASPTLLFNHVYTPSGTGWIYGYNIAQGQNDWEFYIGSDINGSMPVTSDSCLLVPIEKQYISGNGGVMKIDPRKNPQDAIVWFMPTDSVNWLHWEGGIIGSATINDATKKTSDPYLAIFIDCQGFLYIVDYENINTNEQVYDPNNKFKCNTPKLLAKIKAHQTISTPIIIKDRIFVATDSGAFLYQLKFQNDSLSVKLLDKLPSISIDATPIAWNGKIYIAALDGYLYCLGRK
jgi:outer membrane protein assembly factor BamB